MMKKVKPIPLFFVITALIGLASAAIHIYLYKSPQFADMFNSTASYWYRKVISTVFGILPFSFAEFLLFASPILVVSLCVVFCKYSGRGRIYFIRAVCLIVCLPIIAYSMFVFGIAPGYRGTPVENKLELDREEVSANDLYRTAMSVITELNRISKEITFDSDGTSVMPYGIDEMNDTLNSAYMTVNCRYPFINTFKSGTKPLVISKYMTYTHLSGMYTFFTGEASINTNYPDFVIAYSAAHEMAHQRGISKEDEANFIAFLACKESEDVYLQYCAYINMYSYLSDALYEADKTLYASVYYSLNGNARGELDAYSRFFEKYRDNKVADISDKINNDYLKRQGTDGVKSYGMVVDLAVAYYKK